MLAWARQEIRTRAQTAEFRSNFGKEPMPDDFILRSADCPAVYYLCCARTKQVEDGKWFRDGVRGPRGEAVIVWRRMAQQYAFP